MGYSKIANGFFASKGPAHGERWMRGIMLRPLDSRGDGAGRDNKFSFLFPLSVGPAGVWTRDLPLSRPALSQLS